MEEGEFVDSGSDAGGFLHRLEDEKSHVASSQRGCEFSRDNIFTVSGNYFYGVPLLGGIVASLNKPSGRYVAW